MVSLLRQLRIKTRIYLGFGLLVACAAGVAGFGIDRLMLVRGRVNTVDTMVDHVSRLDGTVLTMEAVRRAALRVRTDRNESALATVKHGLRDMTAGLRRSEQEAVSDARRQVYHDLVGQTEAWGAMFGKLTALQEDLAGQREALTANGDKLTAAMRRLLQKAHVAADPAVGEAAADVQTAIFRMQMRAWRFLAAPDENGPAKVAESHDEVSAALQQLGPVADDATSWLIDPLGQALDAYVAGFNALCEAERASNDLYFNKMVPGIIAMQAALQGAKKSLDATLRDSIHASDHSLGLTIDLQIGSLGTALSLGAALSFVIGRGIVRPLDRMTATMQRLAGGDTLVEIPALTIRNEIGDMARAVGVFKENLIRANTLAAESAAEQARKAARHDAMERDIAAFDGYVRELLESLAGASAEMRDAAQSMTAIAEQTSAMAGTVAAAAGQASGNVQAIAAATEEMACSVREIASRIETSGQVAARAVGHAQGTDAQVRGLSAAAQKIEAVVALINGIAGQTNLLALNATIEAARAGEAGKGFAVVASEVKTLAGQTGRATGDIGSQVKAIQAATHGSVEAIKVIAATIDEINAISGAIAAAMDQQGATAKEMALSAQEAATGTASVVNSMAEVWQGASATGAAASQVLSAATALGHRASALRAEVGGFLEKMRAA